MWMSRKGSFTYYVINILAIFTPLPPPPSSTVIMNQPPPPNYVIKACPPPPPPPPVIKTKPPLHYVIKTKPSPLPLIKTLLKALYVGRKASPLQLELGSGITAFRGTYREWLGPKILSSKFKKIFPRNNFSLCSMLPWSLWAENIFSVFLEIFFSDRKFFKSKYFKSFSGNYSLLLLMFHVPLIIMSRKYFFGFSWNIFFGSKIF